MQFDKTSQVVSQLDGADVVLVQCGRKITSEELACIRDTVRLFPNLSRKELAHTVCEHLEWLTASGAHKVQACLKLLDKLEAAGQVQLPPKRFKQRKSGAPTPPKRSTRTEPGPTISGELATVQPVHLEVVTGREATRLWNEYVDRYHGLGFKKPFGCTMRYFISSRRGRLGCLLMAGAAKSIGVRDRWIGWAEHQRLRNLPWVINNTRFLLFPWVRIQHLASHALGQLARRVRDDWDEHWGYRPVLMETFVDPAHYQGVSYRAAGWTLLGQTTGEGLRRSGRQYSTTPKRMFVRSLVKDFREQLCSDELTGKDPQ